jgi:hypothetical protein
VAVDDTDLVPRNHSRRIEVVANDTDAHFDALTVTEVSAPSSGTAVIAPDGVSVIYTPPPGAPTGHTATFDYVISDGRGGSDSGRVTARVDGDPCIDPTGYTVLTDVSGDAAGGQPGHDIQSLSIRQGSDGKFTFILKMASLLSVPPDTTWPVVFFDAGTFVRFVKMANMTQVCPTGVCFAYGNGSSPSVAGTPADPSSNFSADGTIRIVVSSSVIGNPQPGQELRAFLSRIRIEIPGAGALIPDSMPNSLVAGGRYGVVNCGQ